MKFKKLIIVPVLAVLLYSCKTETKVDSPAKTETPPVETKAETNSTSNNFKISYNVEGKMNGTIMIYKKDNKLKQEINSELMGMKTSNKVYILEDYVYTISNIDDRNFGSKVSLKDFGSGNNAGNIISNFSEFEKYISGKKVKGTENILGYDCDIYDIGGGTELSVHNKKYILRIKNSLFIASATKLETDPAFADDEFILPPYVEYKNSSPSEISKDLLDSLTKKLKK